MNLSLKSCLLLLACMLLATHARCQESDAGDEKRVQYQLVLPDEKTPESVKPEEHNPFESESEAQNRLAPGDTEENRVRDKLLKLPVVGTKRMADGRMRVLLGDIILETGGVVPKVLPEQLVELRVKNITTQYVELAWQEKRATGLPPKLMVIPINIAPKVRFQLLGQVEDSGKGTRGTNATMDMPLRGDFHNEKPAPSFSSRGNSIPAAEPVLDTPPPTTPGSPIEALSASPKEISSTPQTPTSPAPPPGPTPVVESVVRMLFGNPTPAPK